MIFEDQIICEKVQMTCQSFINAPVKSSTLTYAFYTIF